MFNALTSDQLLGGVGAVLRMAAATEGSLEEYERSQLLSAFSVTRLLAAEQRAERELLAQTKHDLAAAMRGDERDATGAARDRLDQATSGVEVGAALVDLLAALPRDDATRTKVHGALRTMVDREVAALGRAPE